jgi:DNA-binding response OmpR family regulator
MKQPKLILLVDDQPNAIEALEFRLKRSGYRTITAQNGELGIEAARKELPDAVILDVSMPELNGFQTCRALKKIRPELPVIMLTGKSESADRFWASECGADEFFVKPTDPAVVVSKLSELLER